MSRENVAELNRGRSTARRQHTFSGIHGQCPLALRESSKFQNLDKKRELAGWRAIVTTSWLNGVVPQQDFSEMSRRFSNLQYISIGILFGTCVFLWTRKLNLTKQFQSNETVNLRQVSYYRFLLIDGRNNIIISKIISKFFIFKLYQLFN